LNEIIEIIKDKESFFQKESATSREVTFLNEFGTLGSKLIQKVD